MDKKMPRVGCAGLITKGNLLLMGVRDKEPNKGLWVLPGGGVDFGEYFEETLVREIREETSIEIEVMDIFKVYQLINMPNEHRIIVYLNAKYKSGSANASSDIKEVSFLTKDEIRDLHLNGKISPFVVKVLLDASYL